MKFLNLFKGCFTAFLFYHLALPVAAQQSVVMQHNDLGRTGWFQKEKSLTINNVKAGSFGKIFERTVDDQLYAQPLIVSNGNLQGVGIKNILIAATVNN